MGSGWSITKGSNGRSHRACEGHSNGLQAHVENVGQGAMKCPPEPVVPSPPPPPAEPPELSPERLAELRTEAGMWALRNGFRGVVVVDEPVKVQYPRWGHGWAVSVREEGGEQRGASCRFDASGRPTYWTMDRSTV